jgi:PilZ domain
MLQQSVSHSVRFNLRVQTPSGVWAYWYCGGYDDVSRVRNLSLGGLFVETSKSRDVSSTVKLEFLVQEGQIRADAVVRRVEPGLGLALKLMAVNDEDRPRLAALMNRLRHSSGIHRMQ